MGICTSFFYTLFLHTSRIGGAFLLVCSCYEHFLSTYICFIGTYFLAIPVCLPDSLYIFFYLILCIITLSNSYIIPVFPSPSICLFSTRLLACLPVCLTWRSLLACFKVLLCRGNRDLWPRCDRWRRPGTDSLQDMSAGAGPPCSYWTGDTRPLPACCWLRQDRRSPWDSLAITHHWFRRLEETRNSEVNGY